MIYQSRPFPCGRPTNDWIDGFLSLSSSANGTWLVESVTLSIVDDALCSWLVLDLLRGHRVTAARPPGPPRRCLGVFSSLVEAWTKISHVISMGYQPFFSFPVFLGIHGKGHAINGRVWSIWEGLFLLFLGFITDEKPLRCIVFSLSSAFHEGEFRFGRKKFRSHFWWSLFHFSMKSIHCKLTHSAACLVMNKYLRHYFKATICSLSGLFIFAGAHAHTTRVLSHTPRTCAHART